MQGKKIEDLASLGLGQHLRLRALVISQAIPSSQNLLLLPSPMFFIFIWLSRQPALLSPLQAPPSIFSALPTGRRPELVISVPRVAVPDKTRVIFISLINNQEAPSPGSPESQRGLEGPRILPVMLSWELSYVQNRKTQVFRIREKQEEMRGSVVRFLSLLFSSDTVLVIKK